MWARRTRSVAEASASHHAVKHEKWSRPEYVTPPPNRDELRLVKDSAPSLATTSPRHRAASDVTRPVGRVRGLDSWHQSTYRLAGRWDR